MANSDDILTDVTQLRMIIKGLKIAGLGYVDQEALTSIQARIKLLPSAEQLDGLVGKPIAIKNLAKEVGEIIKLIEIYGKRGSEMKYRERAIKQLPPRYKVLEWENNMNTYKTAAVRSMVKMSSKLDELGQPELSGKLIVCAKNVLNDRANIDEINSVMNSIKATGNTELMKEAGFWDSVSGLAQGAWQGVKNIGHQIADPARTQAAFNQSKGFLATVQKDLASLTKSLNNAYQFVAPYGNQVMTKALQGMISSVNQFEQNGQQIAQKLEELDMNLKQTTVQGGGAQSQNAAQNSSGAAAPAAPSPSAPAASYQDLQAQLAAHPDNPANQKPAATPPPLPTSTPSQPSLNRKKPMPKLMQEKQVPRV